MRYAVHGFTETVAAWIGVIEPSDGILSSAEDVAEAWVRQVPKPVLRIIARSPGRKSRTLAPVERISTTPSLPATAEGVRVPRAVVKGGLAG